MSTTPEMIWDAPSEPYGTRRRHTRLHDALLELEETHKPQAVEVPEDKDPVYYQKYTHMLAARWGMRVRTGLHTRAGQTLMFIQERER